MTNAVARILNDQITLLDWKIIDIELKNLTIQGLFNHIVNRHVPQLKERILKKVEVRCSRTKEQDGFKAELECIVSEVVNIFGKLFITFEIKDFSNDNNSQPVNTAFRNNANKYRQTRTQLVDSRSISQSQVTSQTRREYHRISNNQYIDKQERFNNNSLNFQQSFKPMPKRHTSSSTNNSLYQQNFSNSYRKRQSPMVVSSYSPIQEISSPGAFFISRPMSPERQYLSTSTIASQGLNTLSQTPELCSSHNNPTNLKNVKNVITNSNVLPVLRPTKRSKYDDDGDGNDAN